MGEHIPPETKCAIRDLLRLSGGHRVIMRSRGQSKIPTGAMVNR